MENIDLQDLLIKYRSGQCTPEELISLENWYLQWKVEHKIFTDEMLLEVKDEVWQGINKDRKFRQVKLWPRIAAVASILILIGIGLWFFNTSRHPDAGQDPGHAMFANDIPPGTNKAILTLANGKVIHLSDSKKEIAVHDTSLTYNDGTEIASQTRNDNHNPSLLTITTPRGGTYKLTLSDGTQLILNAASSLRFPSRFTGNNRTVELTGEAYFMVKHNTKQPFRIQTAGQIVEDIGTEFNINAYNDEATVKTTLVEGSVRVIASITKQFQILKPNQQSILTQTGIKVQNVDPEEAVSWKNGYFMFDDENLGSIMRKIERWYNVEVTFQDNNLSAQVFSGTVSKFKNVSELLDKLQNTGPVKFKVKGRNITVMNN